MYRDCTSFHWGAKEAIQHAVDLFPPEQNPLYPSFYMDYNCVVRSLRLLPEKQEHDKGKLHLHNFSVSEKLYIQTRCE